MFTVLQVLFEQSHSFLQVFYDLWRLDKENREETGEEKYKSVNLYQ